MRYLPMKLHPNETFTPTKMNRLSKFFIAAAKRFDKNITVGMKQQEQKAWGGLGTFDSNDDLQYRFNDGKNYIIEGYDKNSDVFAIVSLAARKLGQVPWYVYKVKKGKTKELKDYVTFSRNNRNPGRAIEIRNLRKKALDENVVDNELSELLATPNPNHGQDSFFEQLYGYKLLTGEGNIWKNRGKAVNSAPLELFIIPKSNLTIVPKDRFRIGSWVMELGSSRIPVPVENIINWRFPNYNFDPETLDHLRGQPPLMSMYYDLQAGNEGAKNRLKMNKNQGARGVLSDKTGDGLKPAQLTPQQHADLKRLINGKINNNDVAGSIAVLQGVWDYMSLGMDAGQLKMIEQSNLNTQKLCAGFNVPYEFFNPETTFANKEMAGKHFLYNHIAPAAYSLRDELNRGLLEDFGLSDSQYIIEPDVMALPEAMEDLGKQIAMLKDAWWIPPNRKLEMTGEEKNPDPNMDKIYIPSGFQPLEKANELTGAPLDEDEELLRQNGL